MLKGRVEEARSTVTGLTDLANLKCSYSLGHLAVVRMEHKLGFYYGLARSIEIVLC